LSARHAFFQGAGGVLGEVETRRPPSGERAAMLAELSMTTGRSVDVSPAEP
jgi:hypothetical protein